MEEREPTLHLEEGMKFVKAATEFLDQYKSQATKTAYWNALIRFFGELDTNTDVSEIKLLTPEKFAGVIRRLERDYQRIELAARIRVAVYVLVAGVVGAALGLAIAGVLP